MINRKIIYAGVFSFLAVLIISSFASAGIIDSIKKIFTGEPQLGPFNASVTIAGAPPKIIWINSSDSSSVTTDNFVQPIEAVSADVYVQFVAEDSNGQSDLPDTLTLGATNNVQIILNYSQGAFVVPTLSPNPNIVGGTPADDPCFRICTGTPCSPSGDCPGTGCTNPNIQRKYQCNLTSAMPFYYQPEIWRVNMSIKDNSGGWGGGSGANPWNDTHRFNYTRLTRMKPYANLSWESISTTAANQRASQNLTIINFGNVNISSITITSFNMTNGTGYQSQNSLIPVKYINATGALGQECGTNPAVTSNLRETIPVVVNGFNIKTGALSINYSYFCIATALNTHTPSLDLSKGYYSAVGDSYSALTGTKDWELENF